jgi:hypothetical protein
MWRRIGAAVSALVFCSIVIGYASAWYSLDSCADDVLGDAQRRNVTGWDMEGNVVRPSHRDISAQIAGPFLVEVTMCCLAICTHPFIPRDTWFFRKQDQAFGKRHLRTLAECSRRSRQKTNLIWTSMKRIEPTIGNLDLDSDPAAVKRVQIREKSSRQRSAIAHWSVTLLLLLGTVVLFYVGASYAGVLPEHFKFGAPFLVARLLIVAGFTVLFGSQLIGAFLLFRHSFQRGLSVVLFPGYLLIGLKRSGIYWQVMGPWCVGMALVVVGTMLLS